LNGIAKRWINDFKGTPATDGLLLTLDADQQSRVLRVLHPSSIARIGMFHLEELFLFLGTPDPAKISTGDEEELFRLTE
jgi:hypothetical protein